MLFLFFISPLLSASERWLRVELIVFEQLHSVSTEYFEETESVLKPVNRYANADVAEKSLYYQYNKLKKSVNFNPMYYQSWQLPVKSGHISLPIKIEANDLRGWIKLQRGYLLNVMADLEFKPKDIYYHLQEKRRVLFDEIHYLDHPKFGVIVKVSGL